MTLLLGVLGGVRVNPYLIDAVIGFSVVYKAFENMDGFRRFFNVQPNTRIAVLVFGFFHGFGLATKLQDFALSKMVSSPNILSFNVGVEIGQVLTRTLASSIAGFGLTMGRLKTGTPPRLHRRSIDFDRFVADGIFVEESGDAVPQAFSFLNRTPVRNRVKCWLLHTTAEVHDLVRDNVDKSPLYNGQIRGHRTALLPVARRQGDAVPGQGAAPDLPRARGARRRRDLRERVFDVACRATCRSGIVHAIPDSGTPRCSGRVMRWNTTSSSQPS